MRGASQLIPSMLASCLECVLLLSVCSYQYSMGGKRVLTLDQVMSIMIDIKNTGDWKTALRHVPERQALMHERVEEL